MGANGAVVVAIIEAVAALAVAESEVVLAALAVEIPGQELLGHYLQQDEQAQPYPK